MEVLLGTSPAPDDKTHATPSPHVLVCIKGEPLDREIIRQGRVLADLLAARLTVLHAFRIGGDERQRVALTRDREYARSVGAQLVELPAYSEEDGIAEYAQTRGVTHVVLNEAGSPAALVDRLEGIDWYFVISQPRTAATGQR